MGRRLVRAAAWASATVFARHKKHRAVGNPPSLVPKAPGDVDYYCRFHPNMKARISLKP